MAMGRTRSMRSRLVDLLAALIALGLAPSPVSGAEMEAGASLTGEEIRQRWHGRLDGRHFAAEIRLLMRRGDDREERRLVVWRDDEDDSRERLMARFEAPFDLRGVGLLYLERSDRSNDYFLYQPRAQRVRRIAERLVRQDLYGIDLEHLGMGRGLNVATEVEEFRAWSIDDRTLYCLSERAREFSHRFETRRVCLDPETFIPVQTEYVRNGRVTMRVETLEVRWIQGVATPIRSTFTQPLEDQVVTLVIDRIDYETPIPDAFFSTLKLIKR